MPQISEFFGIQIYMYWHDHYPPHFHAKYASFEAIVAIQEGIILKGMLPMRQLKLVLAWCELHKEKLLQNWERCCDHQMPEKIEALR